MEKKGFLFSLLRRAYYYEPLLHINLHLFKLHLTVRYITLHNLRLFQNQ